MTPPDLLEILAHEGATLGFAESLTGGLLTDAFITVPGASAVVRGGIIAYATDLKAALLGVDEELLIARGAVDPQVAQQMAQGARDRLGATYGLATTGVAGPDPQDGHPVGTVYIGMATPREVRSTLVRLTGQRTTIRRGAVAAAVAALAQFTAAPGGVAPHTRGT